MKRSLTPTLSTRSTVFGILLLAVITGLAGCGGGGSTARSANTTISGRVAKADTGGNLGGVTVQAFTATKSRDAGAPLASSTTGDDGSFLLEFYSSSDTQVRIVINPPTGSGYAQFEIAMTVSAGATISDVTLRTIPTLQAANIASVTVTPATANVLTGAVQTFTAVVRDTTGQVMPLTPTWTVESDGEQAIGVIDGAGQFTALKAGTGTVKAICGGQTGEAAVTVTPRAPTITDFSPAGGAAGTVVTITGDNLSGATVKFNNTTATTITHNSATSLRATVPSGATTGKISVTTAGGTATSEEDFTVTLPTAQLKIADYLPQHVGDTWLFNFSYAAGYDKDQREVIGATTTFHGKTATPLNCTYLYTDGDIDNWTEYRLLNASGYALFGMFDPDENTIDPSDGEDMFINPSLRLLPATVTVGATYTASASGVSSSVKVASQGPVTVPAGTFTDTLKLEITFTFTDEAPMVQTWWLARNIGMIKKNATEDEGTPFVQETHLELRYANINGQTYGNQARSLKRK